MDKKYNIVIISKNDENSLILTSYLDIHFPKINYQVVRDFFQNQALVNKNIDLIICDSSILKDHSLRQIHFIKSIKKNSKMILSCNMNQTFLGLRSVVEGCDDYFKVRKDYARMFGKIMRQALEGREEKKVLKSTFYIESPDEMKHEVRLERTN